jgi:hypothetical protein
VIGFILTIVGISLSGVMAPGPITAATLAAGERNRNAGAWVCAVLGHAKAFRFGCGGQSKRRKPTLPTIPEKFQAALRSRAKRDRRE